MSKSGFMPMVRLYTTLCMILLVSIAACTNEDEPAVTPFPIISKQDSVTIVETSGGPQYADQLFTCDELFRVKMDETIEESLLARPIWMGMDEGGMIYVIDQSVRVKTRIIVYDQRGEFSHVIGQEGDGPGEYRAPEILSIRDGIVTIFDESLRRLSIFSQDGNFLRLYTHAPGREGIPDQSFIDSNDNQIVIYRSYSGGWISYMAVMQTTMGDTLGIIETPRTLYRHTMQSKTARFATPPLFKGIVQIDYCPERGIMVTTGEHPIIEWYNLAGQLSTIYHLGLERVPITTEDRALAERYFKKLWSSSLFADDLNTWKREADFPKFRAFWNAAHIDESGHIWLEDSGSQFHPTERLFRVVSPRGLYLGDCILPKGNGRISHGHYLLIHQDQESGDYHLIVYRLNSAVKGLEYP